MAKGGVSRSRGENLQGHPTRRQAICGRCWARRVFVESSADRRACRGTKGCRVGESILGTGMSQNLSRGSDTPLFISYSSKHRDLTRELADVIEAQFGAGSVWWDHALESRASYSEQIKAALEKARVVVVIWTAGAMISDYVLCGGRRRAGSGQTRQRAARGHKLPRHP